jgi:hypothetical protein
MAGGAGIIAAAGMLQVNAEIEGDVEQGLRFAVILVRQLPDSNSTVTLAGRKVTLGTPLV